MPRIREFQHHVFCSGDRRFPRHAKGKCCSCPPDEQFIPELKYYAECIRAEYTKTIKVKARDLIEGWPRGRSTSAFTGVRYIDSANGFRYRVWLLPWERQENGPTTNPFTDWQQEWLISPDFRRTTEEALESEYRAGQRAMVDEYRARYRRLTHEDLQWLRYPDRDPLKEAMKSSFYRQYLEGLSVGSIPLELALTIKNCAENDAPKWLRFRRAQT